MPAFGGAALLLLLEEAPPQHVLREALRFYPRLTEERLRFVLVHAGATILPELGPQLDRSLCQ